MTWLTMGAAAIGLSLFLTVPVQAGHDKDHDKDHDTKHHDKDKDKDKGKNQDELNKFHDQVIALLQDQVARDATQVGLDQNQFTVDSLPFPVGHPERVALDGVQLAKSGQKLAQDQSLLDQALSEKAKSDKDKK